MARATDDIYQEIIAMQAVADDVVTNNDVISTSTGITELNDCVKRLSSRV